MQSIKLTLVFLLCAAFVTGCTGVVPPAIEDSVESGSEKITKGTDVSGQHLNSAEQLELNKNIWEHYSDQSSLGVNYRHLSAAKYRMKPFDQALIAYYDYNGSLPTGDDVNDIIEVLQREHLMPFWPADPETGSKLKIVGSREEVTEWSEIFLELTPNGCFKNYAIYNESISPFNPVYKEVDTSIETGRNFRESVYIEETGDEILMPDSQAEAFQGLVNNWFRELIVTSFLVHGGRVPVNLQELMSGYVTINETGWGHPTGALSEGEPGNFEFGTDPVLNAVYIITTSSQYGVHKSCYQFAKRDIGGEMIYDITVRSLEHLTDDVEIETLNNKIPLLTDDLFAENPPAI